ncbi:MAG: isocitrate/isopropylmalate family dehydrogenase, partial [Elusimicrobiota bacterium]
MSTRTITLIPGDGTGPELTETTIKVIEATGVKIQWEIKEAGSDVMEKYGTPLPDDTL